MKITLYTKNAQFKKEIKKQIEVYKKENEISFRTTDSIEELIKIKTNVCIMHYKEYIKNLEELDKWQKANKTAFVFIAESYYQLFTNNINNFFIFEPIKSSLFTQVLNYIKQHVKEDIVIIQMAHNGERIVPTKELNCALIEGRNIVYYLSTNEKIVGPTLQTAFGKQVKAMIKNNESLLFIPPSNLINLSNIKSLDADSICYKNDLEFYYARSVIKRVQAAIKEYYKTE